MADNIRRLILANGEKYVQPQEKKLGFGLQPFPRSYGEARDLVKKQVTAALDNLRQLPRQKVMADEAFLCLRLHPDMMAKTYDPYGLFRLAPGLENVGSRNYRVPASEVAQTARVKRVRTEDGLDTLEGRMVFVRGEEQDYREFLQLLDAPEQSLPTKFREDIQRVERFDLLRPEEQMLGFGQAWTEGRVELVLHPSDASEDEQLKFLQVLLEASGYSAPNFSVAPYPDGPTFISCRISRNALEAVVGANPLRTAHPLAFGGLPALRSAPAFPAPKPAQAKSRSTIKVGIFDGGIDPNHPLLKGHAEQDDSLSIKTPPIADAVAHGTAVAGAVLYGPLNDVSTSGEVPAPKVSVVSFRALPTSDASDINLYESIDVIEAAVPARRDISVYNISFGPRGPILDDTISRFTYALDSLATTHRVTFCVAVGNDGEAGPDLDRVQAPSDLVNGLGVGAHTKRAGVIVHAPYSCKGPGRECGKIKPDVVAFGGCDQEPIHLLSIDPGKKVLWYGTSFASPIVAALCAEAAVSFDRSNALLARALLVHTAKHPTGHPDKHFGHGVVVPAVDDLLACDARKVSVVFQGSIPATKFVRLPIMLPANAVAGGRVHVSWTIAALPTVSPKNPTDYTDCCIQDTFYPNSKCYRFTRKNGVTGKTDGKNLHIESDADEIAALLKEGWVQAELPVSQSRNDYPKTEQFSRTVDYKWEPIVRRQARKNADNLHEPFLVLHAIPRNGCTARLEYAVVVTIEVPKHEGDLYDAVLRRYSALQPIRLRSEAELRVQI